MTYIDPGPDTPLGDDTFEPSTPLERDLDLLDRYFAHELTEDEAREVERRIKEDREFYTHVEPIIGFLGFQMLSDGYQPTESLVLEGPSLAVAIANMAPPEAHAPIAAGAQVETRWARFWRNLWETVWQTVWRGLQRTWRVIVLTGKGLRHGLTVVGLVMVVFMIYNASPLRKSILDHQHGRAATSGIDPTKIASTMAGQTHLVTLDHGSTVTLGPGSRFSYRFGRAFASSHADHQAALDGEALLEVTEPWLIVTAIGDAWLEPGVYAIQSDTIGTAFYMRVDEGSAIVWHNTETRPDSIPMTRGDRLKLTVKGVSLLLTSNQANFPTLMPRQ